MNALPVPACSSTLVLLLSVLAFPALADPCAEVTSDTIAEMRAGASGGWSDDVESLVRAAAGSACVKALSGRYSAGSAGMPADESVVMESTSVPDAAAADLAPGDSSVSAAAEEGDDDTWSFGGLTFRSMSGSPGKKPYERQREPQEN